MASAVMLLLLGGCPGDPELTFNPGAAPLVVGQLASVVVTEGGDGSELEESSLKLTDARSKVFGAQELAAEKLDKDEVRFTVPPGIAAGSAALSLETSKGPAFSGNVTINRLVAMRDLAGKVWLLALTGAGGAAQFAEAKAGVFGFGIGHVAVGLKGRMLATSAATSHELYLAWMGATLTPSPAHTFDSSVLLNRLCVTAAGVTLVATSSGLYAADAPTEDPPAAPAVVSVTTDATPDLAVDASGARAVAISDPGTGGDVSLALLDLSASPPTVVQTLATSWTGGGAGPLRVAMSPDGKQIVAVDGENDRLALFVEGQATPVEADFPAGESGPVAVVSGPLGGVFYVANEASNNLSKVQTADDQVTFGSPVDLSADSASGLPVALAASQEDEVVVLMERDMILVFEGGDKASTLEFPYLFKEKSGGEVGGDLAIQP